MTQAKVLYVIGVLCMICAALIYGDIPMAFVTAGVASLFSAMLALIGASEEDPW